MKIGKWALFLIPMVLATVFLFSFGEEVTAHSPTHMNIKYEPQYQILMVNITHPVEDNSTHYISGVKICLRESVFKEYNYTSQPTNETFQYFYSIEAEKGDKIKVAAYCNIEGDIHDDLVVGAINPNLEIPGYEYFCLILGVSMIAIVGIVAKQLKRKK